MNARMIIDNRQVFLRACEGLPVLFLLGVILAAGWLLRRDTLF
jgi:hypothetical protein